MKNYTRILFIAFLSFFFSYSKAQEVNLFGGVHFIGYEKDLSFKEYTKPAFGIAVKDIFKGFGVYGSVYSMRVKPYGDTTVVHELYEYRTEPFDSAKYDLEMMPFGWSAGLTYTFKFRLSVYCGGGVAFHRTKHIRYDNRYNPTSTGFYTDLAASQYSEQFTDKQRGTFELGAEYDFIPSKRWACGLRVGYNSSMKLVSQVSVGFNFSQPNNASERDGRDN